MKQISLLLWVMIRGQKWAFVRGGALAALVLMMGVALLGLSGWFITAAAAAGLAGAGLLFDVFRPSAMVRFLALGRTGARYGERMLTHDATLRAVTALRLRLLASMMAAPWERFARMRAGQALNRVTADVDALDGIPLRLALPVLAGLGTLVVSFAALWWLVDLWAGIIVAGGLVAGTILIWVIGSRAAKAPSRRAEMAAQAYRTRFIDLVTARDDLTLYGQLGCQVEAAGEAERRRTAEAIALDRVERRAGLALSVLAAAVTGGVLYYVGDMAAQGHLTPARAAIAVFVSLALFEAVAPLRRALGDVGRIKQAARRVAPNVTLQVATASGAVHPGRSGLEIDAVTFARGDRVVLQNLTLRLDPGDIVALTGPSGCGKSTLLQMAAGLIAPASGAVRLGGASIWSLDQTALRARLGLVAQRASLLQGSVAENLRLGAPEASDEDLWAVLDVVQLTNLVAERGGLEAKLGPRGAGLSGGESRRLALARALLRRPDILLLDEPTEGLDHATAEAVLAGIHKFLPNSALLIAAHRPAEIAFSKRVIRLAA